MSEHNGKRLEVVVVTGASAGVGRTAVCEFVRRGARRAHRPTAGALVLLCDVSEAGAVERELGPIDIWVNSVMASVFSPAKGMTAEDFRRVTEVTYRGYVHGTLAALQRMLPHDRGTGRVGD